MFARTILFPLGGRLPVMSAVLLAATPQTTVPFTFRVTGARVFSLEEALFHCRAFWKQTADDVFGDAFSAWLRDALTLPAAALRLKELRGAETFAERLLGFLTMTDYYDEGDVAPLRADLARWESRLEWERLKDRADELAAKQPERALALYRRALEMDENAALFNNAGVAALHLGQFRAAEGYFERAMALCADPAPRLNHIEALIGGGQYDKAEEALRPARAANDRAELHYFRGEIEYRRGNYPQSVPCFEQAYAQSPRPAYALRLADAFLKLRRYDKALAALQAVPPNTETRLKEAETHAAQGNLPAAVRAVDAAIEQDENSAALWRQLSAYCRMDYNPARAEAAAARALTLSPDDPAANLEYARLRKAQGKIKDYQTLLRKSLSLLKRAYRETAD